ncbi:unnamed protein product [Cuscuta campestris]|uniref:At1g68980-like TPR repeats domain-containing protein n=1 Tax=Cuscuta campestris TaxID=132261 RepID=A0A484KG75_9ASTE|nr:unnamed protein product [Cuscuta campestris]
MAPELLRKALSHRVLARYYYYYSSPLIPAQKLSSGRNYAVKLGSFYECDKLSETLCSGGYLGSDMKLEKLSWGGSSRDVLLRNLETSLVHHKLDEAWDAYSDFKRLYGFPDRSLVARLVTGLSYSSERSWLRRACDLAISIQEEKSGLLHLDSMAKLTLSLARAQMPIRASKVLRLLLLKRRRSLPCNVLQMIFLHLVKTKTGALLASNILVEICDAIQQSDASKPSAAVRFCRKPDTVIFNLVLDACARFGSSIKGQTVIELMARVGVAADAQTIASISSIYETNGMRDEMMELKKHIDRVPSCTPRCHYRQFYESLLSLHFKFDDIDSASELISDMYLPLQNPDERMESEKPCQVPLGGSHHIKNGLTLRVSPHLLEKDTVLHLGTYHRFVTCDKEGRLILTNKALAKLMLQYKRCERIADMSKLLCRIQSTLDSSRNMVDDVVDVCVYLGWLETAHDILDDVDLEGNRLATSSYMSLYDAYNNLKMFKEAALVQKLMRKANGDMKKLTSSGNSDLKDHIAREMREEEEKEATSSAAYKLNSSIYFFMKAHMIEDAKRAYKKMQKTKIQPTVTTYANLIRGYFSIGMDREITFLWGDIRRNTEKGLELRDNGLYEMLLLSFLRGGYFERVMEVIGLMMEERGVYLDKWMYKYEFLKFHKDLYRHMGALDARNEVQKKRIAHVNEFKKWAGID